MKHILVFVILMFLSGCVVQGSSVNPLNSFEIQSKKAVDSVIYRQAQDALNQLQKTQRTVYQLNGNTVYGAWTGIYTMDSVV